MPGTDLPPSSDLERLCPPSSDLERVWWERVRKAGERRGLDQAGADWSHAVLRVLRAHAGDFELVEGGWQPTPPERCTDDYKRREIRRLNDELGKRVGAGACPRKP